MRRYWMISLAIGGGALLLALALAFAGAFDASIEWLRGVYGGWSGSGGVMGRYRWIEIPVVAVSALGIAWSLVEMTRPFQKALAGMLAIAVILLVSPTLALYGIFFDPFTVLVASSLAVLGGWIFGRTGLGRRKRLLEEALGTRVSGRVFGELLEAPEEPAFEGAKRGVTTLVCRFFPPDPDRMMGGATDALKMGSLFWRSVSTFLLSRGAYLEESGPETIRVSFGMLREGDDHALQACRAALDLRNRLRGLGQEFESRWFQPLRCGVGIESGEMTVGLCGEPGRFFFAGMGGGDDFAGRLAFANARFGSDLLIGPETYRLVRERFEVRPMEMVYDPERLVLLEIHQLLATSESFSEEERRRRDHFWTGVIRLRERDYEGALGEFSRSRVPGMDDAPLAYLTGKAQEGIAAPEARAGRLIRDLTEEGHARLIQNF